MSEALIGASIGTNFTFLMTALGAAMVIFCKNRQNALLQKIFLGFAAGVMIAASIWSLLIPAIEQAQERGEVGWFPAAGGCILGVFFLIGVDYLLNNLISGNRKLFRLENVASSQASWKRTALLILSVTLHNIPEGMATGLAFALAVEKGNDAVLTAGAWALAIGIGIQNFPEGAAISLPLRQEGMSRRKAFLFGSLSGIVEPIFGIGVTLIAHKIMPYMPWFLAFAAGAMLYVVVEELIPNIHLEDAYRGKKLHIETLGVITGFLMMMILDVSLG